MAAHSGQFLKAPNHLSSFTHFTCPSLHNTRQNTGKGRTRSWSQWKDRSRKGGHVSYGHHIFCTSVSFWFGERVAPGLRQGLSGTWRSCAQQSVWSGLSLMFLPGGQFKVSLSLVAAAITLKYLGSASPHTYSIAGSCCPKRVNRATTLRIPVGQSLYVPVQPDPPATQIIAPGIPLWSTVCLSCWFIGLESWTHTQMRR